MMTKVLLCLCFIIYSIPTSAFEIVVCNECEVVSIRAAIMNASPHDTLLIKKGLYLEHDLIIEIPLTIIGEEAIIDAEFKGGVLDIRADSIYISGLTINNIKTSYTKDLAGLLTYGTDHFIIENLVFNNPFFALLIQKSKNGIIRNVLVNGNAQTEAGSGNGIHLWHSRGVTIENNFVFNMRDGIYLEFVKDGKVINNYCKGNLRYGLHFMFSDNNQYSKNTFEDNGAGVAVMFSKKIIIRDNLFKNNWGSSSYGLLLKEIYDADISGNVFDQNTIGINSEGSSRINYSNNVFSRNGWAVKVSGGCFNNTFTLNDFLNNTFDISYQGRSNQNTFNGNHWSDYSGYDLDKDGVGDIPYRPVKLFSYIVSRTPETIILHRSLFVDIVNFSEKVSPIFTPKELQDITPVLKRINDNG